MLGSRRLFDRVRLLIIAATLAARTLLVTVKIGEDRAQGRSNRRHPGRAGGGPRGRPRDLVGRIGGAREPPPQAPQPEALFEFEQEADIDADEINVPEVDFSEGLMSRASANAAEDAFARLSSFDESAPMMAASVVPASANGVLEALVKDALKPVLKAWLDEHLPTMVEELVRQEIQRLAQAGRRR